MATSDAMGFGQATSTTACFISRRRSPRQAKPHVLDGASRPLHKHRLLVLRLQVRVPSTPWAPLGAAPRERGTSALPVSPTGFLRSLTCFTPAGNGTSCRTRGSNASVKHVNRDEHSDSLAPIVRSPLRAERFVKLKGPPVVTCESSSLSGGVRTVRSVLVLLP